MPDRDELASAEEKPRTATRPQTAQAGGPFSLATWVFPRVGSIVNNQEATVASP